MIGWLQMRNVHVAGRAHRERDGITNLFSYLKKIKIENKNYHQPVSYLFLCLYYQPVFIFAKNWTPESRCNNKRDIATCDPVGSSWAIEIFKFWHRGKWRSKSDNKYTSVISVFHSSILQDIKVSIFWTKFVKEKSRNDCRSLICSQS